MPGWPGRRFDALQRTASHYTVHRHPTPCGSALPHTTSHYNTLHRTTTYDFVRQSHGRRARCCASSINGYDRRARDCTSSIHWHGRRERQRVSSVHLHYRRPPSCVSSVNGCCIRARACTNSVSCYVRRARRCVNSANGYYRRSRQCATFANPDDRHSMGRRAWQASKQLPVPACWTPARPQTNGTPPCGRGLALVARGLAYPGAWPGQGRL